MPCRIDRILQWKFRLEQEQLISSDSRFITLTYDEQNLPKQLFNNLYYVHSLNKPDIQKFFKRYRKNISPTIKYYATGEYGEQNGRPHFHIIMFESERPKKICPLLIHTTWNRGKIDCGSTTSNSIRYTLSYIEKKLYGEDKKKYIEETGLIPAFSLMSKNLGGDPEQFRNKDYHLDGNVKRSIPRYYKSKLYKSYLTRAARNIETQAKIKIETEAQLKKAYPRYSYKTASDMVSKQKALNLDYKLKLKSRKKTL